MYCPRIIVIFRKTSDCLGGLLLSKLGSKDLDALLNTFSEDIVDYLTGGTSYKDFYDFMSGSFQDSLVPSEIKLSGQSHDSSSVASNAWYAMFLNTIGNKEEAFQRMDLVEKSKDVQRFSLSDYGYKNYLGVEPLLLRALAYSEMARDASIFHPN